MHTIPTYFGEPGKFEVLALIIGASDTRGTNCTARAY